MKRNQQIDLTSLGAPRQAGVTLIELLIAVAIISILSAIAYPSYQAYVAQGNRAEAKGILLEASQFLERNYSTSNCYHQESSEDCGTDRGSTDCAGEEGEVDLTGYCQSPKSGTAKYNISFSAIASQSYTLQAVPTGVMADDDCGTLTLSNTGVQGAADIDGDGDIDDDPEDNAICWQR